MKQIVVGLVLVLVGAAQAQDKFTVQRVAGSEIKMIDHSTCLTIKNHAHFHIVPRFAFKEFWYKNTKGQYFYVKCKGPTAWDHPGDEYMETVKADIIEKEIARLKEEEKAQEQAKIVAQKQRLKSAGL